MVSRQALHRVLAGKAAVSPEMALRLGKFCGNGPEIWLRMQQAFDLWHARKTIAGDLQRIRDCPSRVRIGRSSRPPSLDQNIKMSASTQIWPILWPILPRYTVR